MRNMTIAALLIGLASLSACSTDEDVKEDTTTEDTASDTGADTAIDTGDTSSNTATCTDSTGTYNIGDTWDCPDGCNTCGCVEPGVIASTDMSCGDTGVTNTGPGAAADSAG